MTTAQSTLLRADAAVYHHAQSPDAAAPAAAPFHSPPHPWGALTTACLTLFLIAVNTTAINTAVSAIADELTVSASTLGWALNAYLLAVAAFVVLGGELGDILGRRRIFLVGLGVYTLSALVVASSESSAQLIAGRAVQGLGSAFLMPATMSILRDSFPKERQGFVLGIWGAVGGVGFAVGPLIGGFFTDVLSWRWVWWSNLPVVALLFVMAVPFLAGLPQGRRGVHIDWRGAALLGVGLFAVIMALQQGSRWGWTSPSILGLAIGGIVLLIVFVVVELRLAQPLMHLRLLRIPAFTGGNLGTFVNAFGLIGILYFFNLYVQSVVLFDWSALRASVALLPYGMAVFLASLVVGPLTDRVGARWPIAVGMGLMAVGCFLLSRVSPATTYATIWWPSVLAGLGVGITFSAPSAAGLRVVPPEEAGEASGVINIFRYVGATLVVAVGSLVYTSVGIDDLNQSLEAANVGTVEEEKLDRVLTGSPAAVDAAIDDLGGQHRRAFVDGAGEGTANGFGASMLVIAVPAAVGALAWIWLLSPKRRHSG
jgi:DHA2 family methylenomycin A resistance protein-like MFS transporter